MAEPISLSIVRSIKTRLEAINTASGFNTTPSVYIGAHHVSESELKNCPAILVYDTGDDPTEEQNMCGETLINMSVTVEGVQRMELDDIGGMPTYLWQDIMRAVFLDDTTLGGLALSVLRGPREFIYPSSGGETVAVRQAVNIIYQETYGNP